MKNGETCGTGPYRLVFFNSVIADHAFHFVMKQIVDEISGVFWDNHFVLVDFRNVPI